MGSSTPSTRLKSYKRDASQQLISVTFLGALHNDKPLACNVAVRAAWSRIDEPAGKLKLSTDRTKTMHSLPTEQTQALRFCNARSARSTIVHEDYVMLISDLLRTIGEARPTDIARRLGVSHSTATGAIARLKRDDLVRALPYRGVFLTIKGEALAKRVRARRRLVVDVMLMLGVPQEAAEADAEGIKHYVSNTTLKALSEFLRERKEQTQGMMRNRLQPGRIDRD